MRLDLAGLHARSGFSAPAAERALLLPSEINEARFARYLFDSLAAELGRYAATQNGGG